MNAANALRNRIRTVVTLARMQRPQTTSQAYHDATALYPPRSNCGSWTALAYARRLYAKAPASGQRDCSLCPSGRFGSREQYGQCVAVGFMGTVSSLLF